MGFEPDGLTIASDGKTVLRAVKMETCSHPLHTVSAQLFELGLTLAREAADDKSMGYLQCNGSSKP